MRGRSALGAALVLTALWALPGCGSSNEDGQATNEAVQSQRELERQLSGYAQRALRTRLHDKSVTVNGINCQNPGANTSLCIVAVSDGTGHNGTLQLAVETDQATHTARISFVRASNRHWQPAVRG